MSLPPGLIESLAICEQPLPIHPCPCVSRMAIWLLNKIKKKKINSASTAIGYPHAQSSHNDIDFTLLVS